MNKKKEASSTETTSGSTSGSSTSSSSSSGTDSSSSSDSDTSSSQISSKQSATEVKKCTNIQKSLKQNIGNGLSNGNNDKTDTKLNNRSKLIHRNLRPVSKVEIFSTDDEEPVENPGKQNKSKLSNSKSVVNNESKETCIKNSSNNVVHKSHALENKSMQKLKKKNVKNVSALKILDKSELNKKKSIFSPENSSDDLDNKVKTQVKPAKKLLVKSAVKKPLPKANQIKSTTKLQNYTPKLKSEIQSVSSEDESSSSDSSSCSDSDSSLLSKSEKKKSSKLNLNSNSDSDNDNQRSKQAVRKSTRYANVRKSKHLLGKNPFSDTDSDTESTKRSSSRSPVKRAPVSTKGNVKNKRTDVKISAGNILLKEERKCPLENCNSLGHLSGKAERHFTIEACPTYHNFPIAKCKEESIERKKREEIRKKSVETFKKYPSGTNTHEQKQYLQYIREMRTKFKFEPSEETKCTNKSKEPCLDNFVPEYDLKLFRDAQAISSEKIEDDLKSQPNTKGTKSIEMGKYEMEVWYQSPYPEDYARLPKLYICEFCLRYMKSHTVLQRHVVKCVWRHPPGEEVYRRDKISVWEVDGKRYKQYCQNLCLLAKFFLDHKTLYYDVEPFLFYIMTMYDSDGCHTVGYFSKEKNSFLNYNVSCILTLPPYQRQGYGRLLIDFSYLLTRVEGKIGSPEKPLSDLGLISYRSYWKDVLLGYLCANSSTTLSVKDISQEMAIHSYDIVSTLQALGMMKYWKGKHIILKKQDVLDEYVDRTKRRGPDLKEVDRNCLRWNPLQPNPA